MKKSENESNIDHEEIDAVWDLIKRAPAPQPSDDFVERTVARAMQQPIPITARISKTSIAWAAAACLLLSTGSWWLYQNRSAGGDRMAIQTQEEIDTEAWIEETLLLTAAEDLEAYSNEELAFLLGF